MNRLFLGKNGLINLVSTLTGKENIYIGIRPRGIHAGNKIPLLVYPYIISQLLKYRGITPRFTINYFLNDYEQYTLVGPDKKKYPFNVLPLGKTLQYEPYDKEISMADYWCPIIQSEVEKILKPEFPHIKLNFIRSSSLKKEKIFKKIILQTVLEAYKCRNILYKYSGKQIRVNPTSYCMAVCRKCKQPSPITNIEKKDIFYYECHNPECGNKEAVSYDNLDFWLYHKPLAIPRIKLKNIDLCITGIDHYNEGDFITRDKLFEFYNIKVKKFKTLYTPVLIGKDGVLKMSKSKDNFYDMDFTDLLNLVKNTNSYTIFNSNYNEK